jgi:GT2 family glycosyltransferase
MQAAVIVATRNRAREVSVLLERLSLQTLTPVKVIVVGTTAEDLPSLQHLSGAFAERVELALSPVPGSSIQRNHGLDLLAGEGQLGSDDLIVAFFDDDFRPERGWLQHAARRLLSPGGPVGVTGRVLADGVTGPGLTEAEADLYIEGRRKPEPHWTSAAKLTRRMSLYGCNMAVGSQVARDCRFDTALPLYGWLEDFDFTGQARRYGQVAFAPDCVGVHLGSKGGRTSGVRFGYSQIANPLHVTRRRNLPADEAAALIVRALGSNLLRTGTRNRRFDYPGRLKGNLIALGDLLGGRCHPRRITDI